MRVICTSPWIPVEWIKAHGLEAAGIFSIDGFELEAMPLSAGVCAFAETAVRCAERIRDAAFVFSTACDQMRRGFEVVASQNPARLFLFNLPATWQTPAAAMLFRSEVERLGTFLESLGGHHPSDATLAQAMSEATKSRREWLALPPDQAPIAPATAISQFPICAEFGVPQGRTNPCRVRDRNLSGRSVPIAVVGGPLPRSHHRLLDAVETAGGRVVLNATEPGEHTIGPLFEGQAPDPFTALVEGYFNSVTDVFQRPNTRLYDWLRPRLAARGVRGIVLWYFTACDLWRAEAQSLREAFRVPVLALEADEMQSGWSRAVGRLQAFVETLE